MMQLSSFDGAEKIVCNTGTPTHTKLMEAYKLCLDRGYTHYGISVFPGAMSCISLGDHTYFGLQPISNLYDEIELHLVEARQCINTLTQKTMEIEQFMQEFV